VNKNTTDCGCRVRTLADLLRNMNNMMII